LVAIGKPKWTDRYFDPASTLVEDRVVLFQATDFEDAIKRADIEAQRYCKATRYKNIYGQSVQLRFLKAIDAFSMLDNEPGSGSEVYSSTAIVPTSVRDVGVVTRWFGKKERGAWQTRNKFIHGQILADALQSMKQSATKRSTRPAAKRKIRS
jgi:hypothetical protein